MLTLPVLHPGNGEALAKHVAGCPTGREEKVKVVALKAYAAMHRCIHRLWADCCSPKGLVLLILTWRVMGAVPATIVPNLPQTNMHSYQDFFFLMMSAVSICIT